MRFLFIIFLLFSPHALSAKSFILKNGITVTFEKDTNALLRISYLGLKKDPLFEQNRAYISFTFDGKTIQAYSTSKNQLNNETYLKILYDLLKTLDSTFDPLKKEPFFGQTDFAQRLYTRLEAAQKKP